MTFINTPLTPELMCTDIDKSLSFYIGVLGFTIQYQRIEDSFAMIERQGSRLMLDQLPASPAQAWVVGPLEYPFGRGMNLEIETTDVQTLYDTVRASEARVFLPLEEKWYRADDMFLGSSQFIVLDPDGYMLRFVQYLGSRAVDAI